jgi:formylglycine-generating enzyme required for sulfatase activity
MSRQLFAVLLFAAGSLTALTQDIELQPGTVFHFATVEEGRQILGRSDPYTRAMTPLDRSLQMKANETFSESEFLTYSAGQVLPWDESEIATLSNSIAQFQVRLAAFALPFPEQINLIKTSGNEMYDSFYVRQGSIVFPQGYSSLSFEKLTHIFIHELFHVFSAHTPELRPALYSAVNHFHVGQVQLPEPLRNSILTNPDSFENNYATEVITEARTYHILPVLYAKQTTYDGSSDLFHYADFVFLEIKQVGNRWEPVLLENGSPSYLPNENLYRYFVNIGLPEYSVYQPEETLADFFPHLVFDDRALPDFPRIRFLFKRALQDLESGARAPIGGIFHAIFSPHADGPYLVERSTNLQDWIPTDRIIAQGGQVDFEDRSNFTFDHLFYRVRPSDASGLIPGDTNQMASIPPGTFTMGYNSTNPFEPPTQGPETQVTLTRGFRMGRYEVTQGEYLAIVGTNPSTTPIDPAFPVNNVSWNEANAYCQGLTAKARLEGKINNTLEYRLPTEAEWEYACRAGTTGILFWEPDPLGGYTHAWLMDSSANRVRAVGLKHPNPWGLFDMIGNVAEMCRDRWRDTLPGGQVTDYAGPPTGTNRPLRGNAYYDPLSFVRASTRFPIEPQMKGPWGFRIVLADVP